MKHFISESKNRGARHQYSELSLEETLNQCAAKEKSFQRMAESYLPMIDDAREQAIKEVSKAKQKCHTMRFADASVMGNLDKQLKEFEGEFADMSWKLRQALKNKERENKTFNVTLYGQTMVGKSTLMSILTNGNDDAVGEGGQQTTRVVKSYKWKGLDVTDVPGFDAFEGEEDERLAWEAAKNSDLIVFVTKAESPSDMEAEWLVKLATKCDRPLLCLINCPGTLAEDFDIEDFVNNPEKHGMNPDTLEEIKNTFNEFIHKRKPDLHVEFIPVQLLAEFKSKRMSDRKMARKLHYASNFLSFERRLITMIAKNGVMYKCRSYLSLVDSTVYQEYTKLLEQSESSFNSLKTLKEKIGAFVQWQQKFLAERSKRAEMEIDNAIVELRVHMPSFVDENIESSHFDRDWKGFVDSFKINQTIDSALQGAVHELETKLADLFDELKFEMELNIELEYHSRDLEGASITNYKRIFGWASAGVGAVGAALGLLGLVSGPVGWAIAGVGAVLGIFSWFSDSREKKLREQKSKMRAKLEKKIEEIDRNAHEVFRQSWKEQVLPIEQDGYNKLEAVRSLLISLANVERSLAFTYNSAHSEISLRMLNEAFQATGQTRQLDGQHIKIARIPSNRWTILTDTGLDRSEVKPALVTLGMSRESLSILFKEMLPEQMQGKVAKLFGYFHIQHHFHLEQIKDYSQQVAYVDKKAMTYDEKSGLQIIEQLLNVHFLQTLYKK